MHFVQNLFYLYNPKVKYSRFSVRTIRWKPQKIYTAYMCSTHGIPQCPWDPLRAVLGLGVSAVGQTQRHCQCARNIQICIYVPGYVYMRMFLPFFIIEGGVKFGVGRCDRCSARKFWHLSKIQLDALLTMKTYPNICGRPQEVLNISAWACSTVQHLGEVMSISGPL